MRIRQLLPAVAGSLLLLGACSADQRLASVPPAAGATSHASATPGPESTPLPPSSTGPRMSTDPYADLAMRMTTLGVDVWFETDLVERWLQGPAAFEETLARLGQLAAVTGVRGFKVADELGYNDGLNSPAQVEAFLRDVRAGLRARVRGAKVLVDVVIPELGCLGWSPLGSTGCAGQARSQYPAASTAEVSRYLRLGLVDRLDLSTSLLDEWTYRRWGLTPAVAQRMAWSQVDRLGWAGLTALQGRKALADIGGYQGSPQQAAQDVRTYVDIPTAEGAVGVDIWTWRQQYDGGTVSLLDDALGDNPLWDALQVRHRRGVRLFTHMTPSLLPATRAARAREYSRVADVFDAVFVAAGTG